MRETRVAVVGAGSWGTAIAAMTGARVPTVLWARRAERAEEIRSLRTNADYTATLRLPASLDATADLAAATTGATVVIVAVPSHGFRDVFAELAPHLGPAVPVLSLTKGLEQGSLLRMTEVIAELAPGHPTGVLTGPNLAHEILAGHPAASVVAMTDQSVAADLQALLSTGSFRVYTNPDVVGCEIAGAVKNVVAIASGMADGLGFGCNAKAALITRGLAELSRLGAALGGQAVTFSGLAGMGDLVATCISPHSRNRGVGEQLGRGRTPADVIADLQMVAEGVKTAGAVVELARRCAVDVPIAEQVVAVLDGGRRAVDVIPALMGREMTAEHPRMPADRSAAAPAWGPPTGRSGS